MSGEYSRHQREPTVHWRDSVQSTIDIKDKSTAEDCAYLGIDPADYSPSIVVGILFCHADSHWTRQENIWRPRGPSFS